MFFTSVLWLFSIMAMGQSSLQLSLAEALHIGREQSLVSKEVHNNMRISYWQYRNYRASLFPNVYLEGTLPSLNRSLSQYQQENGIYKFIPNNYIHESLGLTVSQAIPFTGGQVYLQSSVERMDQLDKPRTGSFLAIPFTFTLVQPVFSYNPYKWAKKIEPLKYENSMQNYVASVEKINITTVQYYFELLLSKSNLDIARQNRDNSSKLYDIALAKKNIGTISDDDIMQLNVSRLNADANLIVAENDYSDKMNMLRNYLGFDEYMELVPEIPEAKVIPEIGADIIREKAYGNNPIYNDFKVRLLEAESNVVKAKREKAPDVQLYVSIGNTGSDHNFFDSYTNLQNRQIAEIGISIPILDWGRRKGNLELAKSKYSLVEARVSREENDFKESVRSLIANIVNQPKLLEIYRIADIEAQKRYYIALERFTLGNISVIDMNYAEQEKDKARKNYVYQLYLSWLYYYNLRYITLYDFERGCDLKYEDYVNL